MVNSRILIVDKEEDITSFSSLSKVKKEYKGLKVGHTGTLDKFASGLMVVLVGSATKLAPVFSGMDKSYRATIKFGEETDTLDREGEVIKKSDVPSLSVLESVLPLFKGWIEQKPPIYSAIHINGKRAYSEARKGKEVDMPSRPVRIDSLTLESFNNDIALIDVSVSKGTYIRSLARDIAEKANSSAHLIALDRYRVGPYTKADITGLNSSKEKSDELLSRVIKNSYLLDEKYLKQFKNGVCKESFFNSNIEDGYFRVLLSNVVIAVCEKKEDRLHTVAFL